MNAEEFNGRIASLTPDKQALLRHMIMELVCIIEHPHLPAVLLHVLPSADEEPFALVSAHCLSGDPHEAHRMLLEFLHAHVAALQAHMPAPGEARH